MLINNYPHFAAKKRDLWIKKTAGQTIEKAVDSFKISEYFGNLSLSEQIVKLGVDCMSFFGISERNKLVKDLQSFEKQFKSIIESNKYQPNFQGIADRVRELCTRSSLQKIPEILANVLAVWSLLKSNISTTSRNQDSQSREFWYQPHAVQVLTLLRMFDTKNNKFINQLVQILTGEGKSVVLGTLSIVFALRGLDVHCICYSSYLSKRDYRDFQPVFEKFGVVQRIRYSTVSEMCEYFINSRGNIRELTSNFIDSSLSTISLKKEKNTCKSILLIDEVDVFFGADFYGDTFNPATRIQGEDVYEVMKFIWSNKLSVNLQQVVNTQAYKSLLARFPTWERLLRSEISQMLVQVSDFMFGNPLPLHNRVGYTLHGETSFNIAYGYRTSFAYLHYNESGDIDGDSVKKNSQSGINVICGAFSCAKIPREFTYVMGVSGTLSNLTDIEKQILCSYGISRVALAPSM